MSELTIAMMQRARDKLAAARIPDDEIPPFYVSPNEFKWLERHGLQMDQFRVTEKIPTR